MRLHLLGLPHTVTTPEYSHCAFTGKVLRFPAMMRGHGYDIIHYGVEGAQTQADEHVEIMSREEQIDHLGHDGTDKAKFYADDARTDSKVYKEFNKRLRRELMERVTQSDLVLLPFGHAHEAALAGLPLQTVESGIGYQTLYGAAKFRIFESYAWMHWHHGESKRWGKNYEWVIPNYFDVTEWPAQKWPGANAPVVFLGRISAEKGLETVVEIAKRRPQLRFIICGQGDPVPWLTAPNIEYKEPITGTARAEYLGTARAVLMPSLFNEPFGGVAVEAMLCGTPVLSVDYGAFTETIDDERTGFRCHTLGDWLAALDRVHELDRAAIAARASHLFGYERVAKMYDRAFQQIEDLGDTGWYSDRSIWRPQPIKAEKKKHGKRANNKRGAARHRHRT